MIAVELKDGTILNCSVYEADRKGELPILNHERINYLFSKNNANSIICFQTEMINGKFHRDNVNKYSIEHENEYSYDYPRSDGYMRDWC